MAITWFRAVLLASICCVVTALPGAAQSVFEPDVRLWPDIGASFVLPPGWTADEGAGQLWAPDRTALCGMQTAAVAFATASDLADWMTAYTAEQFAAQGVEQVVVEKRDVATPSGRTGVAVLVDIRNGGRSQRVFHMRGGIAHLVDCECLASDWDRLADSFRTIQSSYDID